MTMATNAKTKNKVYFMVLDSSMNVTKEIFDLQASRISSDNYNYLAKFHYSVKGKLKCVQILFDDKIICTVLPHEIEEARKLSYSEKLNFEKQVKSNNPTAIKKLFLDNYFFGGKK